MGADSWDEMKRAKEEEYFNRQNQQALARLKNRPSDIKRLSPITGEPMEQVTINGVVVDRCQKSGGIWLDAGELEEILKSAKGSGEEQSGWMSSFFEAVLNKKK